MQVIICELAVEHAREATLLWELWHAEPGDEDLRARISAHLDGMLVGCEHGADPLAGLGKPWRGADLFPAAWLAGRRSNPLPAVEGDDADGATALADAVRWPA